MVAVFWLKFPVICAWPPVIGPWLMAGNETTLPSSTTARSSSGEPEVPYLSYIVVVRSPNAFVPSPLKLRRTCQALALFGSGVALAEAIMSPITCALSSTNLLWAESHDTIWMCGLLYWPLV